MNTSVTSTIRTTITFSTATLGPICSVTLCRAVISYYISRYWGYDTINFGECSGCLRTTFDNYPSDWSNRWYTLDILVPTSAGQDCSGNPYTGSVTTCQTLCLRDTTCVGFSRQKSVSDADSTGQCWLKNNIESNQVMSDPIWQTIGFNTTS
jgi:hypothetical protein